MSDAVTLAPTDEGQVGFVGEPRRLHPLTLLLAVIRLGPGSFNILPALLALGVTGRTQWILPALGGFLLLSLVYSWLAWTRFSWRVDDDDVTISSGIVSKTQRVIPFDRIQDVSIEQGLVARTLGLAKVGFETGSAGSDAKDEAKLDAIALADAEALRTHIRRHRGAARAVAEAVDAGEPLAEAQEDDRLLFAMDSKRLLIAGIFNFSLAIFAVLFGLFSQIDDFLPFDPFSIRFWESMVSGTGLEDWVATHQWLAAVGGLLTVLLLGLATGIVRTVLRDYGFRLDRTLRGFRRRRGLTTKTDVTIPAARVQAAVVGTGIVRRVFGWYDVKLSSLASDGKDESDHLVGPLVTLAEADGIVGELGLDRAGLEEGRADGTEWHRSHSIIFLVWPLMLLAITALVWLVLQVADRTGWLATLPSELGYAPLGPFASAFVVLFFGWLDWRHRRWRFDGRLLHIADGFMSRRHIILPARNIQSADIAIGPFSRRFGLAELHLGVPGGKGGQHQVSGIHEGAARALRDALLRSA